MYTYNKIWVTLQLKFAGCICLQLKYIYNRVGTFTLNIYIHKCASFKRRLNDMMFEIQSGTFT